MLVGARTFPSNPYDNHILSAQLKQTRMLLEDVGREPKEVVVDLGFRGVDRGNPQVEVIHRGKYKSLTRQQRRWLKRRQAAGQWRSLIIQFKQSELSACRSAHVNFLGPATTTPSATPPALAEMEAVDQDYLFKPLTTNA